MARKTGAVMLPRPSAAATVIGLEKYAPVYVNVAVAVLFGPSGTIRDVGVTVPGGAYTMTLTFSVPSRCKSASPLAVTVTVNVCAPVLPLGVVGLLSAEGCGTTVSVAAVWPNG